MKGEEERERQERPFDIEEGTEKGFEKGKNTSMILTRINTDNVGCEEEERNKTF